MGQMRRYKKRPDTKTIEQAIKGAQGFLSVAAVTLGVSRSSLYRWINESPKLMEVIDESRETLLDDAESALAKEIGKGNVTAIIFFLKTRGRDRGYSEKDNPIDGDLVVEIEA